MTRSGPNSSTRPARTLNGWPASATSSPMRNTRGVAAQLLRKRLVDGLRSVSSRSAREHRARRRHLLSPRLARGMARRAHRQRPSETSASTRSRNSATSRVVADPPGEQRRSGHARSPRAPPLPSSGSRHGRRRRRDGRGSGRSREEKRRPAARARRARRRARVASRPRGRPVRRPPRPGSQSLSACRDRAGGDLGEVRVLVVEVVLAHVDDGQLPERSHVHDLVQQPLAERAVAEETDGDAICAQQLRRERGAGRDSCGCPRRWRSRRGCRWRGRRCASSRPCRGSTPLPCRAAHRTSAARRRLSQCSDRDHDGWT